MSKAQWLLTIAALALSVILTRALPFLLFGKKRELPKWLRYLGTTLPAAMMGLLVVYCYRDIGFASLNDWLPALLAGGAVAGLQLWKRNMILSIAVGTALYMALIRVIV